MNDENPLPLGALLTFVALCGVLAGWVLFAPHHVGSLNACLAANPGYDCVVGYVRGEAFK